MHMPTVVGYLVGLAQFAGGLAILSGVLIRLGAACIVVVMLGAIFGRGSVYRALQSAL
jgi:uncharacterized membrane protein YphA (DoxX/SURF4 family)